MQRLFEMPELFSLDGRAVTGIDDPDILATGAGQGCGGGCTNGCGGGCNTGSGKDAIPPKQQ